MARLVGAPPTDPQDAATKAYVDAHVADATDAHDASAVSVSPSVAGGSDVQAALEGLEGLRWEPLTNGLLGGIPDPIADPLTVTPEVLAIAFNQLLAATQLVFVDGDVIMVEVP